VALEALRQLKTHLESTQKELEEYKLRVNSLATRSKNLPKSFLMILSRLMLMIRLDSMFF